MKEIIINLNEPLIGYKNEIWSSNPGCYILFQKNNPINRIGGTDDKGILYIGKGDKILKRVNSLQQSVICNADHNQDSCVIKGHNALSQKFYRMRKHLDVNTMSIRLFILPEFVEAKYLESYLLELYVSHYGELPPLNGSYGSVTLEYALHYLKSNNIKLPIIN